MRADLTPYEQTQLGSTLIVKPEAYDCYLRGRFYAQHQNKADNETAMLAFERAIAIDPSFALAYAELAQTYVWKLFFLLLMRGSGKRRHLYLWRKHFHLIHI